MQRIVEALGAIPGGLTSKLSCYTAILMTTALQLLTASPVVDSCAHIEGRHNHTLAHDT